MKKACFVLFALFMMLSSALSQKVTEYGARLVIREAGFEVILPAGFPFPKREISKNNMTMYTTETNRGACLVSYSLFEHSLFETKTIDQILEDAVKGYLNKGSKLTSEKDIFLGNYKGKSVRFTSASGTTTFYNRFDCYVYGDVFVQIAFVGYNAKEPDKKDINDYFKSLFLIDKQFESQALKFAPTDDDYVLYLPHGYAQPKGEASEIESDYGKIPMLMYSAEGKTGACIMASNTYPTELWEKKSIEKVLNDAMDGAVSSQKFKVISKQNLMRDDLRGLSYVVKTEGQAPIYIRYEYCVREPKLYQVAYSTLTLKELNSPEVLSYFRSFELNK